MGGASLEPRDVDSGQVAGARDDGGSDYGREIGRGVHRERRREQVRATEAREDQVQRPRCESTAYHEWPRWSRKGLWDILYFPIRAPNRELGSASKADSRRELGITDVVALHEQ